MADKQSLDKPDGFNLSAPLVSHLPWISGVGRWLLLALLAGHLVLRREFAHRNLADLFKALGLSAPALFSRMYVTELALLLMFPLAMAIAYKCGWIPSIGIQQPTANSQQPGAASFLALLFLLWGFGHALVAFFAPHDTYLIFRQSAMAEYAIVFVYTFLFFGGRDEYILQAAACMLFAAVACAVADAAGWLRPMPDPSSLYPDEALYGQQTLPLAIFGLGLFVVYNEHWALRALALPVLGFVLWRQNARELQSVVPVSIAGSLLFYVLMGAVLAWGRQFNTIKRAVVLLLFFVALLLAFRALRKSSVEQNTEVGAWSLQNYTTLFELYDFTQPPSDSQQYVESARAPGLRVTDPEVYKLNAVYAVARGRSVSVVNNMWRLLMWRRMAHDWFYGRTLIGAGVGRGWDYNNTFFHTPFHYESDPGGLNPHNSYLNLLYRYGAIGFILVVSLMLTVLYSIWKALRLQPKIGDVLLEGTMLFFVYTAIFIFFTVSLEGPSYSLPFWFSLGLLYARARQLLASKDSP